MIVFSNFPKSYWIQEGFSKHGSRITFKVRLNSSNSVNELIIRSQQIMVSDLFQNSTKIFIQLQQTHSHSTKIFIQLQQTYSHSTNIFIQLQQTHSHSTNIFIQLQQTHSYSTNIFIQHQQTHSHSTKKYSFNFNKCIHIQQKNIHSTSTKYLFNNHVTTDHARTPNPARQKPDYEG